MYLLDPEPGLEEKVLGLRNQLQKKKKKKKPAPGRMLLWAGSLMQEVTTTCIL